jgi:hypothetical protein
METEVLNPPANGLDGRQKGVSSITMSDALVLFTIFWGGEVEVDAHGGVEGVGSDGGTIDGDRPGDFKGRVTEAERVAKPATACMLAWAKQVEVANKEEVSDGRLRGVGGGQRVDGMAQKGQGDGFDSLWGRVGRFPGALHLLDGLDNVASGI